MSFLCVLCLLFCCAGKVILGAPGVPKLSVLDEESRPYRVVNASEGGWPLPYVSGPFQEEEEVSCTRDLKRCEAGEGVDLYFFQYVSCEVESMVNSTHVQVDCEVEAEEEDDEEEEAEFERLILPMQCCERDLEVDASVLSTPHGLVHYSTHFLETGRPIVLGFDLLERMHLEELSHQRDENNTPLVLHFNHYEESEEVDGKYDDESNVPLRVAASSRYNVIYRTMLQSTLDTICNKRTVAERCQELGFNVEGGPFPVTYFSIKQVLEAVKDPDAIFYVKPMIACKGAGIEVMTRAELMEMYQDDEFDHDEDTFVIQQGVTDQDLISGHRFDFRFFFLVHNGKVYLHENYRTIRQADKPYNRTSTEDAHEFVQKFNWDLDLVYSYSAGRTGKGKQWMDAVYSQLVQTLPIMEPIIRATKEDKTFYHIFAGDVVFRSNGEALFPEMNAWPSVAWFERGPIATIDEDGNEDPDGWMHELTECRDHHEKVYSTVFADLWAIVVLGLTDTSRAVNDSESCRVLLDGRVREVTPNLMNCQ